MFKLNFLNNLFFFIEHMFIQNKLLINLIF